MSLCLGDSFQHHDVAAACVLQSLHDWSVLAGPRLCPACKSRSFPLLTTCVNMDGKWVATRQIWVTRLVRGVNMIRGPLCLPCTHCVQGPGSVLGVAKRATAALTPLPTSSANMAGKGPSKTSLEGGRNALQLSDEGGTTCKHCTRGVCRAVQCMHQQLRAPTDI